MAGPIASDATLRRHQWSSPRGGAATLRLTVLSALVLAGCTTNDQRGLCPRANILVPASTLTVFRQNAPADPSGELYTVWMSNMKTGCDFDKRELVTDSRVHILFKATRAPSYPDLPAAGLPAGFLGAEPAAAPGAEAPGAASGAKE